MLTPSTADLVIFTLKESPWLSKAIPALIGLDLWLSDDQCLTHPWIFPLERLRCAALVVPKQEEMLP